MRRSCCLPIFAFNDGTVIAFPLQGFTTGVVRPPAGDAGAARGHAQFADHRGQRLAPGDLPRPFRGARGHAVPVSGQGGDHGFHHAAAGPAGGDRRDLASGGADAAGPRKRRLVDHPGHTLLCIPFSIAILQGSFSNMDQSLEEAAVDLGETPFSTFRLITLPLVAPGIVASLLICFTISLDEFIIAFFLSGNAPTLPVYLWGQLRFPARLPMIMALGTILVVLSILLLIVAESFRRRGLRRAGLKDSGGFL
jgi:spermidine/putrescine transport system permease protein